MNAITKIGVKGMSTREIAELTGKDHKHVFRDVAKMLEHLGLDQRGYAQNWAHPQNQQIYQEFVLTQDLTLTLVSGYNVVMRKRIVDRWLELERPMRIPATLSEALRLAADQAQIIEEQQAKITADEPKVAFAESVRDVDGVCSVEKMAKTLGTGRNRFFAQLRADGVLKADNLPYQEYIERRYFKVIENEPIKRTNGKSKPIFTTMITGRGQVWLENRYRSLRAQA